MKQFHWIRFNFQVKGRQLHKLYAHLTGAVYLLISKEKTTFDIIVVIEQLTSICDVNSESVFLTSTLPISNYAKEYFTIQNDIPLFQVTPA